MGKKWENVEIKSAKEIMLIIARGFIRTLHGTIVSILILFSVYGFFSISLENGWAAVLGFVGSLFCLGLSVINLYEIGKWGQEIGKKSSATTVRKGSHVRHGNAWRS